MTEGLAEEAKAERDHKGEALISPIINSASGTKALIIFPISIIL